VLVEPQPVVLEEKESAIEEQREENPVTEPRETGAGKRQRGRDGGRQLAPMHSAESALGEPPNQMAVVEEWPADGHCAGAENLDDWQREPPEQKRQHVPERERKPEELQRPVALRSRNVADFSPAGGWRSP
jgi:hypothetical protein